MNRKAQCFDIAEEMSYHYDRTLQGQLLYDFGFSTLSDRWLARKWHMRIARVRELKQTTREALKPTRKKKRKH